MADASSYTKSIYDEIPYIFQADNRTYPGKTGALGLLYGLDVKPLEKARVLELGCAQGANILPLAERFKGAYCLGIDLSKDEVASGKAIIQGLGLKNIELLCEDFQALDLPEHSFDYIIAHGLFSWIPEHLQVPLIHTLKRYLAPGGLAHISFNVFPAWHLRLGLKSYLDALTEGLPSYTEKVDKAHTFLKGLQQNPSLQHMRWKPFLGEDISAILRQSKHYLAHDFLEPYNHPIDYKTFYKLAKNQGLQILGESQLRRHILHQLHPDTQAFYRSQGSNDLEWNSLYDFLNFHTFRNMLLCHEGLALSPEPLPSSFAQLYFSCPLKPETSSGPPSACLTLDKPIKFVGKGELLAQKPLDKVLLLALAEAYPSTLSLEGLLEKIIHTLDASGYSFEPKSIMDITGFLFYGYTKNQIDFWTHPIQADGHPHASPLAQDLNRYLAAHTSYPLINAHYEMIQPSPQQREVLKLSDGKHSLADISKSLKEKPKVVLGSLEELAKRVLLSHN